MKKVRSFIQASTGALIQPSKSGSSHAFELKFPNFLGFIQLTVMQIYSYPSLTEPKIWNLLVLR